MNFEQTGMPVAKIVKPSTNDKKKPNEKIIYINSDPEAVMTSLQEIKVQAGEKIQHIPNEARERDILYVVGPSGSGKSYYITQFCKEYKKMYPKRPVYLFSSLTEDKTIDKIKGLKRIKLDDNFFQAEFTIQDFANMAVIFDDCDCMRQKGIRLKVLGIMDMILETGRHTNTTCLITAHIATRAGESKRSLNEAHSLTVFPQTMGGKSSKYLLDGYFGLNNKQIQKLRTLPSRWVTIVKTCPMVVLYEKGAYILNSYEY